MEIIYYLISFLQYIRRHKLLLNTSLFISVFILSIFLAACSSTSIRTGSISTTTIKEIPNVTECKPDGGDNPFEQQPAIYGYIAHGLTFLQVVQRFWNVYMPKMLNVAGCVGGSETRLNGVEVVVASLPDSLDTTPYKIAVTALYNAMKSSNVFYKVVLAKKASSLVKPTTAGKSRWQYIQGIIL